MDTTPKFYYLREDGPITGDIEPLNLDGRDIKIVYEEVMIKYKKLNEREFIGVGKLELINLITDLIYLRNCLSPFYIKCTEKEFKTLSKNYSVVNHEKDFSDIYENLGFFRVQPDSYDPDFIFIKRKRRLAVKSKDDYIIDSTFVFAPIDKSYKPKDLSYSKFLIENRIQRLIEVQLHEKLSIKNSGSASEFSESSYFYDISKYTMFKRKSSAKYFTEFNEYHERIEKSLGNIKYDSKTTRESVDFLHKSSNPGYIVFKSDEMRAKNKALMFYEVCNCISNILQNFIYVYELKLWHYFNSCNFQNIDSVSIDFFKKFNYFTVMYDWDEFKDIKSKPKKIDVLNSFITCYFRDSIVKFKAEKEARLVKEEAKRQELSDAENDIAKKHRIETEDLRNFLSSEPVGEKSIDLPKKTDCTSIKYDKGNCEYIRKQSAILEKLVTYGYSKSEWIVLLSVIYVIPLLKNYSEELKNEELETLIDKLKRSKKVTRDDRKKIKDISKIIKKQIIRLGYIYFTFYKYLDSKNKDADSTITFEGYLKYIDVLKRINVEKRDYCMGWYINVLKCYEYYINKHKAIFDILDINPLIDTYFNSCNELLKLSHGIYRKVSYEKNPFDRISVSKNTNITHCYNKKLDLLNEYQKNAQRILIKVLRDRGDEDHER
ncbi:hypothetical protein [Catenibacterium mitsuokai]|uniref:hypothetical protein n=1 Tax=Catenibacterium mitsuokai TaxID=100886 RepID=UPI002E7A8976|nr:hypothetical protein [Catenibacterium tridentinum]